ncbi:hypothetical protein ACJJIL_15545 [Microbulbifer sp. EKSA005]|uniref:hypothetical protein n=1 Tax=Microbulbifer sp. EKSA005 TaxID=3243364 RepID=UPI0040412F34
MDAENPDGTLDIFGDNFYLGDIESESDDEGEAGDAVDEKFLNNIFTNQEQLIGTRFNAISIGGIHPYRKAPLIDIYLKVKKEGVDSLRLQCTSEEMPGAKRFTYLPWKPDGVSSVAAAELNRRGSEYFFTSKLDGCRFTMAPRRLLHITGMDTTPMKRGRLEESHLKISGEESNPEKRRSLSPTRNYQRGNPGGGALVFGKNMGEGTWAFVSITLDRDERIVSFSDYGAFPYV